MSTGGHDGPNPFQSPLSESTSYSGGIDPSARTVELLRQTRPWVLFMAILGTIVTCIMIALMLFQIITLVAMGNAGPAEIGAAAGMIGMSSLITLIYILPIIFLYRYASRIKALVAGGGTMELDSALEAQKSFWKTIGIVAAVFVVLYSVIIVLSIGFAAVG